jgi:hypothetical protein
MLLSLFLYQSIYLSQMLIVFESILQVVEMKEISSLLYGTLENKKFRNNSIIENLKVYKKLRN